MKASLSEESLRDLTGRLRQANEAFAANYTGETGRRQPVHTVYGGAHLFKSIQPHGWVLWHAGLWIGLLLTS